MISLSLYSFWAEQETADLDSDLGEVPMEVQTSPGGTVLEP